MLKLLDEARDDAAALCRLRDVVVRGGVHGLDADQRLQSACKVKRRRCASEEGVGGNARAGTARRKCPMRCDAGWMLVSGQMKPPSEAME